MSEGANEWVLPNPKIFGGKRKPDNTPVQIKGLSVFDVEVSYGGQWISLNDTDHYKVAAESREGTSVSWRRIKSSSPVLEGDYEIHAVKEMVNETLKIYVHGYDQYALNTNMARIEELFSQADYRVRWTYDNYREYWRCQRADYSMSKGHVYTHNLMAGFEAQVPRYPTVSRELMI